MEECVKPSMVQRFILCTDGTVTRILEDFAGEPVRVHKVREQMVTTTSPKHLLDLSAPEPVLVRNVLLRGTETGRNFVYAESLLRTNALAPDLLEALCTTQTPLGLLLRERRMETFRELVNSRTEEVGDCAVHFGVEPSAVALARTYRVVWSQRPAMLITEKFPVEGALQGLPAEASD